MPATSEARIQANRRNALKSTGPKTSEGKERSRQNGLKHGLTGSGVVQAEADAPEVEARTGALLAELAPGTTLGRILVGQIATLSVRMERAARQEEASLANRVRHSGEAFDLRQAERARALFATIDDDPRAVVRELRSFPQGVDRLLEAWGDLRACLTRACWPGWSEKYRQAMAHLAGFRFMDFRESEVDGFSEAALGDPTPRDVPGWESMDREARKAWGRSNLAAAVEAEIAALTEHRATLDFESIERDRAEAAEIALFDPSREATLARRYEAEARRGFFKALKELRQVEAEAAEEPETETETEQAEVPERLASSWEGPSPTPRRPSQPPWGEPAGSGRPPGGPARRLEGHVPAANQAVIEPR